MRKLILTTMVLALSGLSPALARGGGGHGGGMHGGGMHAPMAFGLVSPASPTIPTPGGMQSGGAMHTSMGSGLASPVNPTVPPLGGMQGGGGMRTSMGGLASPADPTVPPSLTPDARLTGSAPLPPHHQPTAPAAGTVGQSMYNPTPDEAALDRKIGSICKGC
jgi:hypothetical protein